MSGERRKMSHTKLHLTGVRQTHTHTHTQIDVVKVKIEIIGSLRAMPPLFDILIFLRVLSSFYYTKFTYTQHLQMHVNQQKSDLAQKKMLLWSHRLCQHIACIPYHTGKERLIAISKIFVEPKSMPVQSNKVHLQ